MSSDRHPQTTDSPRSDETAGPTGSAGPDAAAGGEDVGRLGELGYLSSAVGHHVINAFSAIVSNAELIRSRAGAGLDAAELDAMASAIVETALDASHVARRLIDRARSATAVHGQAAGRAPAMVDLNRVITEAVEADRRTNDSGVEYLLNLNPVPPLPGNASQLRLMLAHIFQNSREAMLRGCGTVVISTSTDRQGWVSLTVRDSGAGMSHDVLRHAAEPFFTTKPERWGVGLSIAHGIWRRHRGTLAIESHPGLGTTVRLSIGPSPLPTPGEPAVSVNTTGAVPSTCSASRTEPLKEEPEI